MSIELNWDEVTGGPDGLELANKIRDFVHTKFQSVPLPRFIRSVTVHDFQFGTIPPQIELKDVTDPLPDFYEENSDVDDSDSGDDVDADGPQASDATPRAKDRRRRPGADMTADPPSQPFPKLNIPGSARSTAQFPDLSSPFLGVSTPGILGGTSNLNYFHSHLAGGLSGSQTPLAAVAGAHHLGNPWLDPGHGHGHSNSAPNLHQQFLRQTAGKHHGHSRKTSQSSISAGDLNTSSGSRAASTSPTGPPLQHPTLQRPTLREKSSVSTLAPTSAGASRPPTRDPTTSGLVGSALAAGGTRPPAVDPDDDGPDTQRRFRERRIEDMQAVFHIKYAGDIKLLLTADILLDYPMPSFVAIPLRLSITGLTFDGVGVLAKIRKQVHFCFLSPEDAQAAASQAESQSRASGAGAKMGSLLQEIRVESEIGLRENGKQSLKNVSKVERFVLEQVRRIFEEEFVYPSFWTFLV
ncbi:hypothetical protein B0T18DRAFT_438402 [Schizothecium vesticola]|uniref:Mitochondrial distribution and morphology protein 12 n=1 Tax=Schizothecium vesticola TaxID=314040 RepID=A0AA40EVQ6_9PEZI|nr:hypothetical protein B0T18DRAFT_438402 [Schizothecium vesticola]